MPSRPLHEIKESGQPVQDGAQTLKIARHPDCGESSRRSSLSQSDSKLLYEIKGSGQPVLDGAQTLKSHRIQKEGTQIVRVLLMSNVITLITLFIMHSEIGKSATSKEM